MSTMLELCPTPDGRKRWSRTECDFLEIAKILNERYELLDGEIIIKVGQNPPHSTTVMFVISYLLSIFGRYRVRTQATMEVCQDDRLTNRPEPDVVVLREPITRMPSGEDVLLAVEVSDTTQADDFGRKVSLYARAGVSEYQVVDLTRRVIIAYQSPFGDEWRTRIEYTEADTIAPISASDTAISVAELLPPKGSDAKADF